MPEPIPPIDEREVGRQYVQIAKVQPGEIVTFECSYGPNDRPKTYSWGLVRKIHDTQGDVQTELAPVRTTLVTHEIIKMVGQETTHVLVVGRSLAQ